MKSLQAGTDSHPTKSIRQVSDFVKGFGQKKSPLGGGGERYHPGEILNAERLTTTAGLTGVGISELETAADHRVAVI